MNKYTYSRVYIFKEQDWRMWHNSRLKLCYITSDIVKFRACAAMTHKI